MFKLFLIYFCNVFKQVRERVWKVSFWPCTSFKKNVKYCLFLYKIFNCLSCKTFWNSCCFSHIDTMWWRNPVLLNWSPTLNANYSHHLHSSLERFFKHCCHVKIFGKVKNMRKKVFACIFWSEWNCKHFILFNNQSEDISYLMDTESFSKNHSAKSFRHSSKHNFVFTQ